MRLEPNESRQAIVCSHSQDDGVEHAYALDPLLNRLVCVSHPPTPRDIDALASQVAEWQAEGA